MTIAQAVIAYFVCWWMLLFMALPLGVRPAEDPAPGISRAAPQKTHMGRKCAAVTVLAALATWGIDILLRSGIVAVR